MTAPDNLPDVAVVGCGSWGKNLVRNFSRLGALAAVCDPDEAGRRLATEIAPGVEVSASFEAALACSAVAIATPAETHYELARRALLADRDVFVEKPLALTYQQGAELVCPESGWRYRETEPGLLRCLDWPEDKPLEEPSP